MKDDRDLPAHIRAEMEALMAMPDSEIDFSDIPPTTDWTGAMRGAPWRRATLVPAVDPDVVAWFEAHTKPGETSADAINRTLREVMARGGVSHRSLQ
jgi:uncharacterized protein (DUF4415 family)